MKVDVRTLIVSMVGAAMAFSPVRAHAASITMSATYFTIAEADLDMNRVATGVFSNEVQSALGPNGLPVLNTAAYGCTSGCFTTGPFPKDVTANGQITWWSPSLNKGGAGGLSDVTQTGTGIITLPYNNSAFFPPNGSGANDLAGLQAALFSTTLNVPSTESISFSLGADDDAFLYLNGQIVCDLGGAHSDSPATCTSSTVAAGSYNLELFYADVHTVNAALTFNVTTSGITGSAPGIGSLVPEPRSFGLMLTAFIGAGLVYLGIRRKGYRVTS